MYAAHELKEAVRTRRTEIGLSQRALAELAGLSRATVVQDERGTLRDLSLSRTASLLSAIGLKLSISPPHEKHSKAKPPASSPLEIAARTASVSYAEILDPEILESSLRTGVVPERYEPHMATLLDEAPVSLLAKVVEHMHEQFDMPRTASWSNMRRMALELKTTREFWNV